MITDYCGSVFDVINNTATSFHGRAYFLDQRNVLRHGTDGNTCCGHPDATADGVIAGITEAVIRAVMGWTQ
jgi:hypothetical protein